MGNIRRIHPPSLKAKVAVELIKETETLSAVCSKYSIHPTQAGMWKQKALQGIGKIFSGKSDYDDQKKDKLIEELYRQIGQLKVELDWLKKKANTF